MDAVLQLRKGRYLARVAGGSTDLARAQALRSLCFGGQLDTLDHDAFDARCTHVLIEDVESRRLVCCFRVLALAPADIAQSYSGQFYDLSALTSFGGTLLEVGRFCSDPGHPDPDILRMAWAFLTRLVDAGGVRLLFGCASFPGDSALLHIGAFVRLFNRHQAPAQWRPRQKAAEVFDFATGLAGAGAGLAPGNAFGIPPLLRTYLLMGGWVSDHAVFDRVLGTMHVFTGVEIAAIPPSRARLLRALAGDAAPEVITPAEGDALAG
jgi:putative hemolysin